MRRPANRPDGFTLLEVMAALAVVAFALAALWKGLSQGIVVTQGVPDRVVARWVAQNRLVLRQARNDWPPTRTFRHEDEMAGRTWYVVEQVEQSEEPLMRRVTVSVSAAKQSPALFTLDGYLARPRPGRN